MPIAHLKKILDENGETKKYTISVNKKVSKKGVNLAFVNGPKISASKFITINSNASNIHGNPTKDEYITHNKLNINDDYIVYNGNTPIMVPNSDFMITDEYSILGLRDGNIKKPVPLFYVSYLSNEYKIDKTLSASKNKVCAYRQSLGYSDYDKIKNLKVEYTSDNKFIYIGDSINIVDKYSSSKTKQYSYPHKIVLIKNSEDSKYVYAKIAIYTDRDIGGYSINYTINDKQYTEVAMSTQIFKEDADEIDNAIKNPIINNKPNPALYEKIYAKVFDDGKYMLKVPSYILTDKLNSRTGQEFRYKIYTNTRQKYDVTNPGKIYVGVYSIGNISGSSFAAALAELNAEMPKYIELINPHPYEYYSSKIDKNNPKYWQMSLDISISEILDYDVIIIAGTGLKDLSEYNEKLLVYLSKGGSIFIDNNGTLGNQLRLDNGIQRFFLNVSFSDIANISAPKTTVNDVFGILSRLGTFDKDTQINIGNGSISPVMSIKPPENINSYTTIIQQEVSGTKYPNIMAKRYFDKGIVVISNCGVLGGIIKNSNDSNNKKLLKNIITVLGEDIWYTTPWIYDVVYHKEQLYPIEYKQNGGTYVIGKDSTGTIEVAKKITCSNVIEELKRYNKKYNIDNKSKVKIVIEQYVKDSASNDFAYKETANVSYEISNNALLVYTTKYASNVVNLEEYGFDTNDIEISNSPTEIKLLIKAFTYYYDEVAKTVSKKYLSRTVYPGSGTLKIQQKNAMIQIDKLTSMLPKIPGGVDVANKYNIYYEVNVAEIVNGDEKMLDLPITALIYNSDTKEYYFDTDGTPCINYIYVNDNETISNNIYVCVINKQNMYSASKRNIAIKYASKKRIDVFLPDEIDEREQFRLRIKNGYFENDYEQNGQTIGKLVYKVSEYDKQIFKPCYPYMQVKDQKVKIVDNDTIELGKKNIYYVNKVFSDVKMERIDSRHFKSSLHDDFDTEFGVTVKVKTGTSTVTIDPTNYEIDYKHGVIIFDYDINESDTVYATYKCINMHIRKFLGTNVQVDYEATQRLDETTFKIQRSNIPSDGVYNLVVYRSLDGENFYKLSPKQYTYKSDDNTITFDSEVFDNIYVSYKYNPVQELSIKSVDVKNGIVKLNASVTILDIIEADFEYIEDCYDYYGYKIGNEYNKLDFNPSTGHVYTYTDSEGKNINKSSNSIFGKTIYMYMLPNIIQVPYVIRVKKGIVSTSKNGEFVVKTSITNTEKIGTKVLSRDYSQIINNESIDGIIYAGKDIDSNIKFKFDNYLKSSDNNAGKLYMKNKSIYFMPIKYITSDKYASGGQTAEREYYMCYVYIDNNIRFTTNKSECDQIINSFPGAVLLATIESNNPLSVDDIVLLDTRKRGGGIKESVDINMIATKYEPNVYSFWDIGDFDNKPYNRYGSIIITLPGSIRQKYTQEQIENIINKYIPIGIKYIVEYK